MTESILSPPGVRAGGDWTCWPGWHVEVQVIVYLSSPNTQQQAEHVSDMPVLLSFASFSPWLDGYQHTFSRVLIDSGAYSEFSSGTKIDLGEYTAWAERWAGHADAVACLDDISGDWRRSLRNYECRCRRISTRGYGDGGA